MSLEPEVSELPELKVLGKPVKTISGDLLTSRMDLTLRSPDGWKSHPDQDGEK